MDNVALWNITGKHNPAHTPVMVINLELNVENVVQILNYEVALIKVS